MGAFVYVQGCHHRVLGSSAGSSVVDCTCFRDNASSEASLHLALYLLCLSLVVNFNFTYLSLRCTSIFKRFAKGLLVCPPCFRFCSRYVSATRKLPPQCLVIVLEPQH